jgi:hypothetical protein
MQTEEKQRTTESIGETRNRRLFEIANLMGGRESGFTESATIWQVPPAMTNGKPKGI